MRAPGRRFRHVTAAGLASAALLVWSNVLVPRIRSPHRRAAANALLGLMTVGAARLTGLRSQQLLLTGRAVPVGVRTGLGAAAVPVVVFAVLGAVPKLRAQTLRHGTGEKEPTHPLAWVGYHIPVGTVLAEELAFRSALDAMWVRVFPTGRRGDAMGLAVSAAVFGLWHIAPARAGGEPVIPTVLFTTAGGVVFSALARCGGSVTAPMLAHAAANIGGALVATSAYQELAYRGSRDETFIAAKGR